MKKYKLFVDILLVMLCLFPLIFALLSCFRSNVENTQYLLQIVSELDISPVQSNHIKDIFKLYLTSNSNTNGIQILSIIISNSIFIYVGYVFVSVLIFVPKLAIKLLRIGIRKEN